MSTIKYAYERGWKLESFDSCYANTEAKKNLLLGQYVEKYCCQLLTHATPPGRDELQAGGELRRRRLLHHGFASET